MKTHVTNNDPIEGIERVVLIKMFGENTANIFNITQVEENRGVIVGRCDVDERRGNNVNGRDRGPVLLRMSRPKRGVTRFLRKKLREGYTVLSGEWDGGSWMTPTGGAA